MKHYFHSVTLDSEKCKGCTVCIKQCPTEAIRVRDGQARITEELCIDCGECIRICPNHAKIAVADDFSILQKYDYTIALPSPSFFGQFSSETEPAMVLGALLQIGFDGVFEVAVAAQLASEAIREQVLCATTKKPVISSACPAVVRLIQVRFPGLLPNIISVKAPMEVAARMAKEAVVESLGLPFSRIGAFFITPCPAKVTAVKQPAGDAFSYVDGVFSMSSVYGEVRSHVNSQNEALPLHISSGAGIGWGRAGGENVAIGAGSLLAVDGIRNVVKVLEEVEKGTLEGIDYLEVQACAEGCIGGPLVVQNPFMAKVLLRRIAEKYKDKPLALTSEQLGKVKASGYLYSAEKLQPRTVMQLDDDIKRALSKMALLEETLEDLPALDCGSCGSPNCRSLAEDIVRGSALEADCVFKLRERVRLLAEEMVDLAGKVPPAMGRLPETEQEEVLCKVKLKEVTEILKAVVHGEPEILERGVTGAYSSDLLSDAMANAKEGNLWFTIQTHPNIVAIASLLNLGAIVITGDKEPAPETLAKAKEEKVVIFLTSASSFEAAGRIYSYLTAGK